MPLIIKCAKCHKNFTLDESNPTCPWCVPAIFWADPNHNEAKHVVGLIEALPKLYTGGYRTLFLEFIYIQATNDREEEFEYCSAGRRGMWGVYSRLIQMAEKLGMLVVGLSLPTYYFFDRQKTRAAGHFRMMGGFDTVAAEIICGHTEGNNFVVFLGSGHWPHLSRRLTLQLTGEPGALGVLPDFTGGEALASNAFAAQCLSPLMVRTVRIEGGQISIRTQSGWIKLNVSRGCSPEEFAQLWQDKVGVPPDPLRVLAILAEVQRQRI